jgi:uncharacterized protein YndB with AHSA1/START domain
MTRSPRLGPELHNWLRIDDLGGGRYLSIPRARRSEAVTINQVSRESGAVQSHERIRHTDRFDDPNLPGEMVTTISLKQASCGTEVNIVQEGIPDVIPPEACYLGWQESLTLLAKLVEAEIPD